MTPDVDAVTSLIEEVARILVLPRLGNLAAVDVENKGSHVEPDDVVTVVDRQVEAHLAQALKDIARADVLGEESAHHHPELLRLVASDRPLWVIDPIDGTKNFASGESGFGVMIAWVVEGRTRAAWLALPARQQTFVAEAGSGAFLNGQRVRVAAELSEEPWRGIVLTRYMPDDVRDTVTAAMFDRFRALPPSGCAAVEYTDILKGDRDFCMYYRLFPWDHAAPALVLTEAGGLVIHTDGRPYSPRSEHQLTIVARSREIAADVRGWLPKRPTGSVARD